MYCKQCGAALDGDSKFCANCGAPVEKIENCTTPDPVYTGETYTSQNIYYNDNKVIMSSDAKSTLTWGILGLAFACSFFLSFLGIIFSAIGMGKAGNYVSSYGILTGRAKVGRILSLVGLIVGIVLTVLFIIYIAVICSAVMYW